MGCLIGWVRSPWRSLADTGRLRVRNASKTLGASGSPQHLYNEPDTKKHGNQDCASYCESDKGNCKRKAEKKKSASDVGKQKDADRNDDEKEYHHEVT